MIRYELLQKQDVPAKKNVNVSGNQYIFDYPCESTSECTDYIINLSRGTYKFELYGASGGSARGKVSSFRDKDKVCIMNDIVKLIKGNAECYQKDSIGGAGGYLSAIIQLQHPVTAYLTLGGKGIFGHKQHVTTVEECFYKENMQPGGYGGGGSSSYDPSGTGSGGGQTAVKFIENDLWHRVLVAGAGGGCDDTNEDDGSGGAGGNLTAQGWFNRGKYVETHLANSTFGFSFGQGEAARYGNANNRNAVHTSTNGDIGGAGGGWFGGFSSQHNSGGAGGGSSFALTKNSVIPEGNIPAYDEFFNFIDSKPFAFDLSSGFLFYDEIQIPGIWEGNGRIIISILNSNEIPTCFKFRPIDYVAILFIVII